MAVRDHASKGSDLAPGSVAAGGRRRSAEAGSINPMVTLVNSTLAVEVPLFHHTTSALGASFEAPQDVAVQALTTPTHATDNACRNAGTLLLLVPPTTPTAATTAAGNRCQQEQGDGTTRNSLEETTTEMARLTTTTP